VRICVHSFQWSTQTSNRFWKLSSRLLQALSMCFSMASMRPRRSAASTFMASTSGGDASTGGLRPGVACWASRATTFGPSGLLS